MRNAKPALAALLFVVLCVGAIGAVIWSWGLRDDDVALPSEPVIPESDLTLAGESASETEAVADSTAGPAPIGAQLDEAAGTPWGQLGVGPGRRGLVRESTLRPPFREIWSLETESPILHPPVVGLGYVFVVASAGVAQAVDVEGGALGWERDLGACVQSSPALAEGLLYVALMSEPPCRRQRRDADGALVALDPATGDEVWRYDEIGIVESSPLVVNGRLFVGSWDGGVVALDAASGEELWTVETADRIRSGQAFARSTVFATSTDGTLRAIAAASGEERWQQTLAAPVVATPAVAEGRVLVGDTEGTVYAFTVEEGSLLWSRDIGDRVEAPVLIGSDAVVAAAYDGTVVALDPESGSLRWQADARAPVLGQPSQIAGYVTVATLASQTLAFDAATGEEFWIYPDGRRSALIVDGERAYLAGSRTLYGLVSDEPPVGTSESSPADGDVVTGATDGATDTGAGAESTLGDLTVDTG